MYKFKIIFFLFLLILNAGYAQAAKLVYVPMDNRPVCLAYTVDTLKMAGWEIAVPPDEIIASRYKKGDPDKLLAWLETECKDAYAAVISSDAVIYGGLVASRTHEDAVRLLSERRERLSQIKEKSLGTKIYVFSTIMRTPKMSSGGVEPPYYEKWGPDIFRLSALWDKFNMMGLTREETAEYEKLQEKIPEDVIKDWSNRRMSNLEINFELLDSTREGDFDYFVLGKDDTAPFSQSHMEARYINDAIKKNPINNFQLFVGADQLGMLLLTRAVNERERGMPLVYARYAEGKGDKNIPSYEDVEIGKTVKSHIQAMGGMVARRIDNAELVLMVNTPYDGITKEASSADNIYEADKNILQFASLIKNEAEQKMVAVADVQFGNGASNALAMELMKNNAGREIAAYAGWNTASNSVGYALSQGLLRKYMNEDDHIKMLMVRFTDDWVYQANARSALYSEILYPKGINGTSLGKDKEMLEKEALVRIKKFYGEHVPKRVMDKLYVEFPWDRMFEIYIEFK